MNGKIHFLNTGKSDCIILESNGKIAMIDAAEDSDFPQNKPHLRSPGYEDAVVNYLLSRFSDSAGKVNIEFVLGTHAHSDHIGGFDTVINHPQINVKTAYLKPYREEDIFVYERKRWDNREVYEQMLSAVKQNGVELVEAFDNFKLPLGDFSLTFFNGSYKKHSRKFGENINSVAVLAEIGERKAFLAADLNDQDGDEKRLSKLLPHVDVLKVGHHGCPYSSTTAFLKALSPDYAVVCNSGNKIWPNIRWRLKNIAHSEILATVDSNGIIADFSENSVRIITGII